MRKIILLLYLITGILSCTSFNKPSNVEQLNRTPKLPLSNEVKVNLNIYYAGTYRVCMEIQNKSKKKLYIPYSQLIYQYLFAFKKVKHDNIDLTKKIRQWGFGSELLYMHSKDTICPTMISKKFLTKSQKDSVKKVMQDLFPKEIAEKIAGQYDSIKQSMLTDKKYSKNEIDQIGVGFIPRCLATMIDNFVFLEPSGVYKENLIIDVDSVQYDKLYLYFKYPNDRHIANRITWNTFLDNVKYPEQINGYEFHYKTIVSDTIEFVKPEK